MLVLSVTRFLCTWYVGSLFPRNQGPWATSMHMIIVLMNHIIIMVAHVGVVVGVVGVVISRSMLTLRRGALGPWDPGPQGPRVPGPRVPGLLAPGSQGPWALGPDVNAEEAPLHTCIHNLPWIKKKRFPEPLAYLICWCR